MFSPQNTRVFINNKLLKYCQAISLGFTVDDIIVEAQFVCVKEPFETDLDGYTIEIKSVGWVDDIYMDSDQMFCINLQIPESAPYADYFKKYYEELSGEV